MILIQHFFSILLSFYLASQTTPLSLKEAPSPIPDAKQFVSQDGRLALVYKKDWVCKEVVHGSHVNCYPQEREDEEYDADLDEQVVLYPDISIDIQDCKARKDPFQYIPFRYKEDALPAYFYIKTYNGCRVLVVGDKIDTEEKLDSILSGYKYKEADLSLATLDQCSNVEEEAPYEGFAHLYSEYNPAVKTGWYKYGTTDEKALIYKGFFRWSNDRAKKVSLENTSPSGDWVRYDDYCFAKNGATIQIFSDLRTNYGDVQVVRTWEYNVNGAEVGTTVEIFDIDTKKPITPRPNLYLDNPPILAPSYDALMKEIEFDDNKILTAVGAK